MGPLIPMAILFGSFWYLDRERAREERVTPAQQPPRFSSLAISRVTTVADEVRAFHPSVMGELDPMLCSSGVMAVAIEGLPPGLRAYRLAPLDGEAATAHDLIEQATNAGCSVFGSLALVLGGAPEFRMLLIGRSDPKTAKFATNPRSVFALLASPPAPKAEESAPAPAPKPKNAIKKQTNGAHVEPASVRAPEPDAMLEG